MGQETLRLMGPWSVILYIYWENGVHGATAEYSK